MNWFRKKLRFRKTQRGFDIHEFTDYYGVKCSLQKSSLAYVDAVWFGVDDAAPKIMSSMARKAGIPFDPSNCASGDTESNTGWETYPLPKDVLLTTRMHLTQERVRELLPALKRFAKTGELE